jgi:hypothetical protein
MPILHYSITLCEVFWIVGHLGLMSEVSFENGESYSAGFPPLLSGFPSCAPC